MSIIPERYNLSNLQNALRNPSAFLDELDRNINRTIGKRRFKNRYDDPVEVMGEDWDTLIILDASRYDIFKDVVEIDGQLEHRISKGSSSEEFYLKNFSNGDYYDTVYVTANPYGASICEGMFHRMETTFTGNIDFHEEKPRVDKVTTPEGKTYLDRHVENLRPEKLTALAQEVYEDHPDKRMIVHYMQPHKPYLSDHAEQLRESLSRNENITFDRFHTVEEIEDNREDGKIIIKDLMNATSKGYLKAEELRRIYTENLEIALEHAEQILSMVDGKSVITSDHGELLGERYGGKRFDHPGGVYAEELRKVPWMVIEKGSRRKIVEEKPTSYENVGERELEQQLELLGYR